MMFTTTNCAIGILQVEVGNGNRITNSSVADKIDKIDTVKWDKSRLFSIQRYEF